MIRNFFIYCLPRKKIVFGASCAKVGQIKNWNTFAPNLALDNLHGKNYRKLKRKAIKLGKTLHNFRKRSLSKHCPNFCNNYNILFIKEYTAN